MRSNSNYTSLYFDIPTRLLIALILVFRCFAYGSFFRCYQLLVLTCFRISTCTNNEFIVIFNFFVIYRCFFFGNRGYSGFLLNIYTGISDFRPLFLNSRKQNLTEVFFCSLKFFKTLTMGFSINITLNFVGPLSFDSICR